MLLNQYNRRNNMGFDGLRVGGGRCPPVILILLIIIFILLCNWWSISTENAELLNQVTDLQDELKICVEERGKCVSEKDNFGKSFKKTENEISALHVHLKKQKEQNSELSNAITICKGELESYKHLDVTKTVSLETLRLEKDRIFSQLNLKQKEIKKVEEELNKVKSELSQLKMSKNNSNNGIKLDEKEKDERENEIDVGGEVKEVTNKVNKIKDNVVLSEVIDLLKSKKDDSNNNNTII